MSTVALLEALLGHPAGLGSGLSLHLHPQEQRLMSQ